MNKYLMRVYNTAGLSVFGALATAFAASASPMVLANLGVTTLVGCLMMFGGFISATYMQPKNVIDRLAGI